MLSLVVYAIGSRLKHIFRREICSIDPVPSKVCQSLYQNGHEHITSCLFYLLPRCVGFAIRHLLLSGFVIRFDVIIPVACEGEGHLLVAALHVGEPRGDHYVVRLQPRVAHPHVVALVVGEAAGLILREGGPLAGVEHHVHIAGVARAWPMVRQRGYGEVSQQGRWSPCHWLGYVLRIANPYNIFASDFKSDATENETTVHTQFTVCKANTMTASHILLHDVFPNNRYKDITFYILHAMCFGF